MNKAAANRLISKCKSWADFTAAVEKLDKKQMGDVFERLTQLYLQTKPLYKTKIKNAWLYSEIPPRVRKKIKSLPTADEGIDLVAETKDGEFWAIQSKYRTDKDKPLTVKELSTFTNLAFNTCKGSFAQAIVVHSVSKPVKKRKLLGNTVEIGLQRWLEMDAGHWALICRTIGNKPARPKKRTPRPHQRKAIRSAATHFIDNKESRGKLIMPCGTGKSLTAFWIANKLDAKTVLLVVPSLALIKQSVEDWTQEMVARGEDNLTEWLCICSDDSAGSVNKDDFVSDTYSTGLPVTTDAKKIGAFLKKRTKRRKIVFVTYQSSPVFAKAARRAGAKFDLAVMDEAHKTAGEKSKAFATLLFDKNLPIKKRIFMTATERVMSGANDDVVSMDKVDIYGDCFYQLSFKEAIHSDPPIISDYKILTIFVTEDEIRSAIKDRQFVSNQKYKLDAKDSRELAAAIALRKAYKKYRIKHAVSFHRSIQAASDFSDLHESLNASASLRPKVECFHISSKKTTGQRTELLKDFADSKRSLITNARCLTEGVDVPAIDCVLFADPKQSTVDIVQAAGRALRPHADKKFGYIMLPIIVPKGKTVDEFAKTTEFKTVSRLISGLSTNDGRIAEEFSVVDRGKRRRGEIIRFDGNVPVGMKIDFEAFADAISAKVWERVAKVNWRPFEEARKFVHSLKMHSQSEWRAFVKTGDRPLDIPANPGSVYKELGWKGYGDWLGTGIVAVFLREFRSFQSARSFARNLNLQSTKEWKEFAKRNDFPRDIPKHPNATFKGKGWKDWNDWLGTNRVSWKDRDYLPFLEARKRVHKMKINSRAEWDLARTEGRLPPNIPSKPWEKYKNDGWVNLGDWLGTNTVASQHFKYRSFEEARKFARSLKLKSGDEWRAFCKSGQRPEDIPVNAPQTYKNKGWKGWGDWLGTGNVAPGSRKYKTFNQARKFARGLKLNSGSDWKKFTKSGELPQDIPAYPPDVYKEKGWQGWGDWLGTGYIAPGLRKYKTFNQARKFARGLKLKSQNEWVEYTKSGKLPPDIPVGPRRIYLDKGWQGWGDWLGTGTIAPFNRRYRSFANARRFAHKLKIERQIDWNAFAKSNELPKDIPAHPAGVYKDKGWQGWGDWLGTGRIAKQLFVYREFQSARKFARSLKLRMGKDWKKYCSSGSLPKDIPANPNQTYRNSGWKGWSDWLGSEYIAPSNRPKRSFQEARAFAQSQNLKSKAEWRVFSQSYEFPNDIPRNPYSAYKNKGWKSWGDWLGTGEVATFLRNYRTFSQARKYARSLKLKSGTEWKKLVKNGKLPTDIPSNANHFYKDKGWVSWGDWLGTGNVAPGTQSYLSFVKARKYARGLGLKNRTEWRKFAKSGKRPKEIPSSPDIYYKDAGWNDFSDWLGSEDNSYKRARPFKEARKFARSLNLKSSTEWFKFAKTKKRPNDIPIHVSTAYREKGWNGMPDFLGYKSRQEHRPFKDAREFARSLNLKSSTEWFEFAKTKKRPVDVPIHVAGVYANKGWKGMPDFLGYKSSPEYQSKRKKKKS